jgi:hypothetical protein
LSRTATRASALAASCLLALMAGAAPALADDISNNLDTTVDTTAEVMSLTVGGSPGSTQLRVVTAADPKSGCNLTGRTTATFDVKSSASSVATVSPSSVTFTSCGDVKNLTVTPVAPGSTSITLAQTQNNTSGTFNVAPATFTVNVAPATPTNTAPTVNVVGAVDGQHYTWGALPSPTCSVADKEDGAKSFAATLTHTEADWIGSQTASCTYTDAGGLTASSSVSYVVDKAASTINLDCPTSVVYTGSALAPCTATVTGVGLKTTLTVDYVANTDAGTATASASYAGDATHAAATSSTTFTIDKASSTTTLICSPGVVYTGDAQNVCSGHVTGAGGLDKAVPVVYTPDNTGATSTGTATATFDGDANHDASSAVASFEIGKATSSIEITCTPGSVFDNTAQTPCSAVVTGAGGLRESVDVHYSANVHAGEATVTASYAGDANHGATSATGHFTIAKAATTTTLTCLQSVTYDGTSQEPCTASVSGPALPDQAVVPAYSADTVNAGDVAVTADYVGSDDYLASTDSGSFTIEQATSSVTVHCPTSVTYTGSALTPCTATVSGAGTFESTDTTWAYADNVVAGSATVTATYGGDRNHSGTTGTGGFTIDQAPSTVDVTCTSPVTYTGSALTPCTASVSGAGTFESTDTTWAYADNVAAGSATVTATYGGDRNHSGTTGTGGFTIDQAPSTVDVTCTSPVTYSGSPLTPCSATVTGAGNLSQLLTVTYGDNTNAGKATASASYPGDANHTGDTYATSFTIDKATSAVTVTCPTSMDATGNPLTPCTARVTGAGGLDQPLPVAYTNNTMFGTATASATWAGDANHNGSTGRATFTVNPFHLGGFYQPVDMNGVLNTVKAGSTVPLKFELFSGSTELTSTSAVKSFGVAPMSCSTTAVTDDVEITTTGGTALRYDTTGGQFIQNWQTPKTAGSCYQVTMTAVDGSTIKALFKLK